jgi:hypothetical protein
MSTTLLNISTVFKLSSYGTGARTGTATYNLAVDATGNVIEVLGGGGGGTTINPTNNFIPVRSNATTFVDSLLFSNTDNLKSVYAGNDIGLKLNFTNNLYDFGDYDNAVNGAYLRVDTANQTILTKNGPFDKGLKVDFLTDYYYFGDYNNVNFNSALVINGINTYPYAEMYADTNVLSLCGSNNTILGVNAGAFYNDDLSANSNNYAFGSDWLMENDDPVLYPFKYNTVLNCYNSGLDTSDKSMKYNLFVNIQDGGFALRPNVEYDSNIANCFIFGLTDFLGSNSLQMWTAKAVPTNVIVLNGSQLDYGSISNNIFSANASNVVIGQESTGIHIIGGDFEDKGTILPSSHVIGSEKRGIIIEGRGASVRNNFVKVTAEKFYQTTPSVVGQVQVQEKQFFMYYPDGSVKQSLRDTLDSVEFYLPNSSSNAVNIKLVSTTGSGAALGTGNSYIERTYLVLVDSLGVLSYDGYCTGCEKNPNSATELNLEKPSSGYFYLDCIPDNTNSNACWVKALVTVNTITIG